MIRLNINWYRNVFHITNNFVKQAFKYIVSQDMMGMPCPKPPLRFTYTLFYDCNRKVDVANVLSVIDKYTSDALTECGIIPDDNYKIVAEVVYRWGGVDKDDPRVVLEIESI